MAKYLMGCIGDDGGVWGLDASNVAFRYVGGGFVQPEPSQALAWLAVANEDNVWGLDAAGNLYRLVNTPFVPTPWPAIWHASVGSDGTVWGLDDQTPQHAYRLVNNQWQGVGGPNITQLFVGDANNVWALTGPGGWWGGPGQPLKWNGTGWTSITGPSLRWITVAFDDQSAWAQTSDNRTVHYDGTNWNVVATNTPDLFGICVGPSGAAYGWDFSRLWRLSAGRWSILSTPKGAAYAGIAADGTLLIGGGSPYRLTGYTTWSALPLGATVIDTLPVSAHSAYFLIPGQGYVSWAGQVWQRVTSNVALATLSAASDGTMWGTDASNKVYRWTGSSWAQQPGSLARVSAGSAAYACGVDPQGNLQYWTGSAWRPIAAPSPSGNLDAAIGSDATMYVVAKDNSVWVRVVPGDWERVQGVSLVQIDCADQHHVAGLTTGTTSNSIWQGGGGHDPLAPRSHLPPELERHAHVFCAPRPAAR